MRNKRTRNGGVLREDGYAVPWNPNPAPGYAPTGVPLRRGPQPLTWDPNNPASRMPPLTTAKERYQAFIRPPGH